MWTLSVCIPIYNSDVRALVDTLCTQIDQLPTCNIDIVLLDDASAPAYKAINQFTHEKVKLIELPQNRGRAAIRNAFLNYSDSKYLLFLDGDSSVQNDLFLNNYAEYLHSNTDLQVLVGASRYQENTPELEFRLRWKYSSKRESLNYKQRCEQGSAGFKTNNFLIARSCLMQFPFEERLQGYGHEDTLFGLQLQQNKVSIQHIDNPVWNLQLDTNRAFLEKTDQALCNLLWINDHFASPLLFQSNQLLAFYVKSKNNYWFKALIQVFCFLTPFLKSLLRTGLAPLACFDLYRLIRLSNLDKHPLNSTN